jgi:integrase
MKNTPLTALEVKNAATVDGQTIRKLHDGGGLYLWVRDDGSKAWRMRFWVAGKEKSLSLGTYPKVSLGEARLKREELQKQINAGLDPSQERKTKKIADKKAVENTFEVVAREWYGRQINQWVHSHAIDVKRRLEADLFPSLGKRPIGKITAEELLLTVRKIEARGAHDLAHRVLQVSGQVFRYGIGTSRCLRDWSQDLKGTLTAPERHHQPSVDVKELPDLLRAIAGYEALGGDKQTRLGLLLLALVFTRTNELIAATWDEFDIKNALWCVPASRMKMKRDHLVPLSKQALEILAELKTMAGDSPWILPGRSNLKPISNNTLLYGLYRAGFKGRMTGHGFRSVASTILHESNEFSSDWIEMQLAHIEGNSSKAAYNKAMYLPGRRVMMQWYADQLEAMVDENIFSPAP